jgi:hypothetical protein
MQEALRRLPTNLTGGRNVEEKKEYQIKASLELRNKLIPFWEKLEVIEDDFYERVQALEKDMEETTGIEGIEFFFCDNSIAGIGNADRTMELIHRDYGLYEEGDDWDGKED